MKKRYKFNPKRFITNMFVLLVLVLVFAGTLELCTHAEKYSTTLKYQLQNKIEAGDTEALEYYNRCYTSKGVHLFREY